MDNLIKRNYIAEKIGHRINQERMSQVLYERYRRVWNGVKDQSPNEIGKSFRKLKLEHKEDIWSKDKCSVIGDNLLIMVAKCGMITMPTIKIKGQRHAETVIYLSQDMEAIIAKLIEQGYVQPLLRPMICKPAPWTDGRDGGYYTINIPVMKRYKKGIVSDKVYDGLNASQSTAWRINTKMLEILQWLMNEDESVDCRLFDKDHKNSKIYVNTAIAIAKSFKDEKAIYFPHRMDHRGRVYPLPEALNPQASKPIKSLLEFSEGSELDADRAYWLAVHLANTYGYDKEPLKDRVDWVFGNAETIHAIADDYQATFNLWRGLDDPFNFLAACFEMSAYMKGEKVVSRVPIAFDGSCSGMQHFAALFKDEVAAKSVNLIPNFPRQDVYEDVALSLAYLMPDFAEIITRKLMKGPVMTFGYGVNHVGITRQIKDELPNLKFEDATKLSNAAVGVIEDICTGASKARDWTQGIASKAVDEGKPVVWTTPDGLTVTHSEYRQRRTRPQYTINDKTIKLSLVEDTVQLHRQDMKKGLSPNLVHSFDATHLRKVARQCVKEGIPVGLIHDCFSTNAGNAGRLFQLIREEFVRMYSGPVLENLMKDFGADESPPVGNLDIRGVLDTEYSFS